MTGAVTGLTGDAGPSTGPCPYAIRKILGAFHSWPVPIIICACPFNLSAVAIISASGSCLFLPPCAPVSDSIHVSPFLSLLILTVFFFYLHARLTLLLQVPDLVSRHEGDSASFLSLLSERDLELCLEQWRMLCQMKLEIFS